MTLAAFESPSLVYTYIISANLPHRKSFCFILTSPLQINQTPESAPSRSPRIRTTTADASATNPATADPFLGSLDRSSDPPTAICPGAPRTFDAPSCHFVPASARTMWPPKGQAHAGQFRLPISSRPTVPPYVSVPEPDFDVNLAFAMVAGSMPGVVSERHASSSSSSQGLARRKRASKPKVRTGCKTCKVSGRVVTSRPHSNNLI